MTDLAAVEKTRDETLKAFGKIDIFVNNAGIAGVNKTVWETDLDEWRKVLRINLDGPFICCKAIVPSMVKQKYGRIINIASIAGKEGNPNRRALFGLEGRADCTLTKSLGKELAAYNIVVNAVTPAAAKTAIFDQMTQQHIDFMLSKIPKNRFVLVEELAALRQPENSPRKTARSPPARCSTFPVAGRPTRRGHDPRRRMSLRRGSLQVRRRTDQRARLSLP